MDFLYADFLGYDAWLWMSFLSIIAALLYFDLGVLNKKQHVIGLKESLTLSGFYVFISCCFGIFVWLHLGADKALDYYTGYVIEQTLSVDNLFVMSIIFAAFHIPRKYQHRVLFWGIIGVIVLRGIMIGVGAALVTHFHFILYIFAAFLIVTGIKLLMVQSGDKDPYDIKENPIIRFITKHIPMAPMDGQKFWVKCSSDGVSPVRWHMTPLLLTLITIEMADLVFAVDSVPAIFAITTDPFIVYTSNIFAILGLRSLYFALSAIIERFAYLKYAISLILIFIGSKVFMVDFLEMEKFPPAISLGVTAGLLIGGIVFSLYKTREKA